MTRCSPELCVAAAMQQIPSALCARPDILAASITELAIGGSSWEGWGTCVALCRTRSARTRCSAADEVIQMRRREFLGMLRGAPVSNLCSLAARAQQAPLQVVGSLNSVSLAMWANYLAGFRKGLSQMSYREGQNVTIEYRWAEGRYDRLPAMADELVGRKVSVIFASGGPAAARAAKAATSSIPIIFTVGTDPVADGLVASMNRPGGNATGVSHLSVALASKRLELLSELVPKARTFAIIANSNNAADEADSKETQIGRAHV